MNNYKLAYIKNGEIHQNQYVLNEEKMKSDWNILLKSKLPIIKIEQQENLEFHFVESRGDFVEWHKVPVEKWYKELRESVEETIAKDNSYLGCKLLYNDKHRLYQVIHTYLHESGMKLEETILMDTYHHTIKWIKFD